MHTYIFAFHCFKHVFKGDARAMRVTWFSVVVILSIYFSVRQIEWQKLSRTKNTGGVREQYFLGSYVQNNTTHCSNGRHL